MEQTGTLNRIQRIILNETATVLILSAFVAFGLFGYLNVYAIVLETARNITMSTSNMVEYRKACT